MSATLLAIIPMIVLMTISVIILVWHFIRSYKGNNTFDPKDIEKYKRIQDDYHSPTYMEIRRLNDKL